MKRLTALVLCICLSLLAVPSVAQTQLTIHRYSEADGVIGSVNSYLIESANGVVIIDSQRVLSQGAQVAQRAKEIGKPVLAILLTHSHPDHVGGLAAIVEQFPDVPIYADETTSQEFKADSLGYYKLSQEQYGKDFPTKLPLPTNIVKDGDSFQLDNITYTVKTLTASESLGMTLYFLPSENILFVGDIVDNQMLPYLLEKRTGEWLTQLTSLAQDFDATEPETYPGHGLPDKFNVLVRDEIGMLTTLRYLVSSRIADGKLDDSERNEVVKLVEELFPNQPAVATIQDLLPKDIDALAEELMQP